MSLGVGLANGTLQGLNISSAMLKTNTAVTKPSGLDSVVQSLGMELTSELVGSLNLSSLFSSGSSGQLVSAAQGLANGLAGGAVVGLGFQSAAVATPAPPSANSSTLDVTAITQAFGQGLTQTFLSNGTLTKATALLGANGGTSNINTFQVAQGLAIGLVDGARQGIADAGGDNGLLKSLATISSTASTFNDSVGGVATGFGLGLGSQVAEALMQVFGKSSTIG
jgi:hypothetical protein